MKTAPFSEIWTETVTQVHAELSETEIIRYTTGNGTAVWARLVKLTLLEPSGDIQSVTVSGKAEENGRNVTDKFLEGADQYPPEIAPLIPQLLAAAASQTGHRQHGQK